MRNRLGRFDMVSKGNAITPILVLTIAFSLFVGHVYAAEQLNGVRFNEMHAQAFAKLRGLLKNNRILEVSTDMQKSNPNYVRGEAFCSAQVKALRENAPGFAFPKPQYIFQGENAADELSTVIVDASVPDGSLGKICETRFPPKGKYDYLRLSGFIHDYEIFRYSGSAELGTVIYVRSVGEKSHAIASMGFITYSPHDKSCGGIRGYGYYPHIKLEGVDATAVGISDFYLWRGEDVFYTTVKTVSNPHIRILLYQPQYYATSRAWSPDFDLAEATVDDPTYADGFGYQCRIEVSMSASVAK